MKGVERERKGDRKSESTPCIQRLHACSQSKLLQLKPDSSEKLSRAHNDDVPMAQVFLCFRSHVRDSYGTARMRVRLVV